MTNATEKYAFPPLSLLQIASWTPGAVRTTVQPPVEQQPFVVRIPSLQRGAVWNPGQVELLWDSILRGFPVGSFVVCERLEKQASRKPLHASEVSNDLEATHHLLDGQQRANAIAVGFDDPFDEGRGNAAQILWIDFDPKLPRDSTRKFLLKLTTQSHPWGYDNSDAANRLGISRIRHALVACGWRGAKFEKLKPGRPSPNQCWPCDGKVLVPFSWLLRTFLEDPGISATDLAMVIQSRCEAHFKNSDNSPEQAWARDAANWLSVGADSSHHRTTLGHLLEGLRRALKAEVVALQVPPDALTDASEQETNADSKQPHEDISNVEHLFQRLNGGGTILRGEELTYSMIKAYWPELERPIRKISNKRMVESRLAMLGARAALSHLGDIAEDQPGPSIIIPGPISVSELRNLARRDDELSIKKREKVLHFFGGLHGSLEEAMGVVSGWLSDLDGTGIGLPPAIISGIARDSQDVYLLLLWLSRRVIEEGRDDLKSTDFLFRKRIIGIATAIHWFAADKSQIVKTLVEGNLGLSKTLISKMFAGTLASPENVVPAPPPALHALSPEELAKFLVTPETPEELKHWCWWHLFQTNPGQADSGKTVPEKKNKFEPALRRISGNRQLLIFAQRTYMMGDCFESYDPTQREMWADRDRPWDFDHILPSAKVKSQRNISLGVREWLSCIGNLRAWPFEDNRSDQCDCPDAKIHVNQLQDSFVTPDELAEFAIACKNITVPENAIAFITVTRNRMLRIYEEWYRKLDISYLTTTPAEHM